MTENTMNRLTWGIALAAIILLIFANPGHADGLTPDQQQAAEVAAGEAPASLVGPDAFRGVVCTMVARLESPRFPDTLEGVLAAYYAKPRTLTAQEAEIAAAVFGGDVTCPALYFALGGGDVARLGLRAGDVVMGRGQWTVHFYAESPWGAK